jgi:hypothetical protein
MEFLREFIKAGYLKAVGKMEDYKVILGASAYFDKGILKEDDLKEISEAIDKQYEKTTDEDNVENADNSESLTENTDEAKDVEDEISEETTKEKAEE